MMKACDLERWQLLELLSEWHECDRGFQEFSCQGCINVEIAQKYDLCGGCFTCVDVEKEAKKRGVYDDWKRGENGKV